MHGTTLFSLLATVSLATAHALVGPVIRQPGPALVAACGRPSFNEITIDPTGNIEKQLPIKPGCALELCRGMKFEDQPLESVQRVIPGEAMSFDVDCTIPHGGPANVSLIDTTGGGNGQMIGSFLATFDDFCPLGGRTPADQTKLQYQLPDATTIGTKCSKPGDCVVQLFWGTPDLAQNYYYCTDVQVDLSLVRPSAPQAPIPSASIPAARTSATLAPIPTPSSGALNQDNSGLTHSISFTLLFGALTAIWAML